MARTAVNRVSNRRTQREELRKRERSRRVIWLSVAGIVALAIIGGLIYLFTRPSTALMGQEYTNLARDHVQEGSDLTGAYTTNPPVGGKHYPNTYQPGFYDEQTASTLPKKPEGYLVHNLEHGYVIYWYNCQADPKVNCDELKNDIRKIIDQNNSFKVIGFPWPSQKQPLVITSWGRYYPMDKIDFNLMQQFYKSNVDKGPEQTPS